MENLNNASNMNKSSNLAILCTSHLVHQIAIVCKSHLVRSYWPLENLIKTF